MQYLYDDGDFLQFMDTETFDQIGLTKEQVGKDTLGGYDGWLGADIIFTNGKTNLA